MNHKLLLADDSITIQRVIELTFASEDVDVIAVSDGEQAIETMARERPDIVLADIAMPRRNGYEVAAYVKGRPELAHVPVLLLAGAFEPVDHARVEASLVDGVLVKPFEPQQVVARVRELLRRAASAKRAAAAAMPEASAAAPSDALPMPAPPAPPEPAAAAASEPESPAPDHTATPAPAASRVDEVEFVVPPVAPEPVADAAPIGSSPSATGSALAGDTPAAAAASTDQPAPERRPEPLSAPAATPAAAAPGSLAAADALDEFFGRLGSAVASMASRAPGEGGANPPPRATDDAWTYGDVPTVSGLLEPPPEWPGATRTRDVLAQERTSAARDAFDADGVADDRRPRAQPLATADPSRNVIAEAFHALLAAEQGRPRSAEPVGMSQPPVMPLVAPVAVVTDELVDRVTQRVLERLVPHAARDMVASIVSDVAERLVREEIARAKSRPDTRL